MAQFHQIALDYLEHYQPERYETLREGRRLRAYVDDLTEHLYAESERIRQQLADAHPHGTPEQHALEAERIAIEQVLPTMKEHPTR